MSFLARSRQTKVIYLTTRPLYNTGPGLHGPDHHLLQGLDQSSGDNNMQQ
jgi:hypothetical protein